MVFVMIPNIIYYVRHKNEVVNVCENKALVIAEQIGRYGCFVFMVFNIPYTYFNFWFGHAFAVYISVNGGLYCAYTIFWAICWKKNGMLKALSLSIIPSCIFLFSGIVLANIPLIVFAVVFAVSHIFLSCKNVQEKTKKHTTIDEKWKDEFILIFVLCLFVLTIVGILFGADVGGAFPLN